jgi:hypothetical protein
MGSAAADRALQRSICLGQSSISGPSRERHCDPSGQRSIMENAAKTAAYIEFTKLAQATGPENIGPERTLPGLLAQKSVNSPPRITFENNGEIWRLLDRENAFAGASGGVEGIRTLETVSRLHP